MRQTGLDFPVLADPDGRIARRWGVFGVPATFVVDAAGQIRAATVGVSTGPGLRARLWLATHGHAGR
jgi:peroxiredoxin